jgi:hypothetical protein
MEKARPLLIAVIAMGVLIVLVTTIVVVKLVKDVVAGPATSPASVTLTTTMLHQPPGAHIVTIAAVGDRLSILLKGGGPDRILFVNPGTGKVAGQLMLGQ